MKAELLLSAVWLIAVCLANEGDDTVQNTAYLRPSSKQHFLAAPNKQKKCGLYNVRIGNEAIYAFLSSSRVPNINKLQGLQKVHNLRYIGRQYCRARRFHLQQKLTENAITENHKPDDATLLANTWDRKQGADHSHENLLGRPSRNPPSPPRPSPSQSSQFPKLRSLLMSNYPPNTSSHLLEQLSFAGFLDDVDIQNFAQEFLDRPEVLSQILIQDFGWAALDAHRARVGILMLVRQGFHTDANHRNGAVKQVDPSSVAIREDNATIERKGKNEQQSQNEINDTSREDSTDIIEKQDEETKQTVEPTSEPVTIPPWKSVLVNDKAKSRRAKRHVSNEDTTNRASNKSYDYGLLAPSKKANSAISNKSKKFNLTNNGSTSPNRDETAYATIYEEFLQYWTYMTVPQTSSPEPIIRERTAEVYLRHARLFIGWLVDARGVCDADIGAVDISYNERESNNKTKLGGVNSRLVPSTGIPSDDMQVRKNIWQLVAHRLSEKPDAFSDDNHVQQERPKSPMMQNSSNHKSSMSDMRRKLQQHLSLQDIFPTTHTDSAAPVLYYLLWLRAQRNISPNYEANLLRGLIKLVKFRFARDFLKESYDFGATGKNIINDETDCGIYSNMENLAIDNKASSINDIPIVIELRKFHREAGNKGKKAPRSSDEGKKWLEWTEYLDVIQCLKTDLNGLLERYEGLEQKMIEGEKSENIKSNKTRQKSPSKKNSTIAKSIQVLRKEIAITYQHYLILAFFACVPDRQRTFRELEIGRNFLRVETATNNDSIAAVGDNSKNGRGGDNNVIWVIKHTADDYKTGATYGERPPLPLLSNLTPAIDDFIQCWRPALLHQTTVAASTMALNSNENGLNALGDNHSPSNNLFLQPRTGNPLTPNSIYQIISRSCYKYKQKKTNPHLLRDMIVTHVRKNSSASEKELEALALFMGHSIQMQRVSYDRRTLGQKVEPAVKLLQSVTSLGIN